MAIQGQTAISDDQDIPDAPAPPVIRQFAAQLRPALVGLVLLTAITGLAYPAAVGWLGARLWPSQAGGGLVRQGGVVVGARLIGQAFSQPDYFHGRPSAAGGGYDGLASGASNLSPANPKLIADVTRLAHDYRLANGLGPDAPIPIDAVTRSASGLDPEISPLNARLQAPRVARARGLATAQVLALVAEQERGRQWGVLGEPRVCVLDLNLALDRAAPRRPG